MFVALAFCGKGNAAAQSQIDSLRSAIAVQQGKEKIDTYHRLMLHLYDIADLQEWTTFLDEYEAILLQEKRKEQDRELIQHYVRRYALMKLNYAYFTYNLRELETAERQARIGMEFCGEHEDGKVYYYRFFDILLDVLDETMQHETLQSETLKLFEDARAQNDIFGMAIATFSFARFYKNQFRYSEAEKYYLECIELFRSLPYADVRIQLVEASRFLCWMLLNQDKYDETLQALIDYEQEAIRHHETASVKDPFDPVMSRTNRIYLSLYYVRYYLAIGDIENAERHCDIAENAILSYGPDHTFWNSHFYQLRARVYAARGKYGNALEAINKALSALEQSPNPMAVRTILNYKIRYLIHEGKADEAIVVHDSLIVLDRQARMAEINAQIDEIRTIYEVDKIKAEKEKIRNYMFFAFAGCILLTVIVVIFVYYNRVVWSKNRGLYRQIKEQDRLAEELKLATARYGEATKLTAQANEVAENTDSQEAVEDLQNRQLVERLHECLMTEKYFAKQKIEVNELATALQSNRTYIQSAVKAVTGEGLQEYIYSLKMNEAKILLETTGDTVETIVERTGFNERTFYRLFRERYNMSPADYRKIAMM